VESLTLKYTIVATIYRKSSPAFVLAGWCLVWVAAAWWATAPIIIIFSCPPIAYDLYISKTVTEDFS
jgi:hypothetical protein